MLFFGMNAPLLTGSQQEQVLALLKQLPAVQTLADAIGAALASDSMAVANRNAAVHAALTAARAEIVQQPTMKSKMNAARVLVDPSNARSGITVSQLGLNSINIRNDYRRRAYYFVEAVSYVPEDGGEPVPVSLDRSEGKISPTIGATSLFGTISDMFFGDTWAYAGVDSGEIEVPIQPQSAQSTTYKITVVGPGAHAGDGANRTSAPYADGVPSGLTGIQDTKKRRIVIEAAIVDFFIPMLVDLFIPIKGEKIDIFANLDHASDLVTGLISAVGNAAPLAVEKIQSGDLQGGLVDLWSNLVADGSARVVIFEAVFQFFDGLDLIVEEFDNIENFKKYAEKFLKVADLADSAFVLLDSCVQFAQWTQSSRAESWKITSTRSKVRLSPELADIDRLQTQVFTAIVPDATDSDAIIVYHWKNSALHGGIRDNQHSTAEFDSSENVVTYFPSIPASPGVDTITVEAFEVRGQNRVSLGTATAKVEVRSLVPKIAPDRTSLVHNESQTFTAKVDSTLANGGALTYKWFGTNKHGHLTGPAPNLETSINTATYKATGTPPGEDTVAVEVFSTKDGVKTSLGIARAQVKIEERKTIIMGSFNVEVQFAQPGFGTGTPGYSFVTAYAKVPKVEGATSYSCRIYNFYDGAYWGHGTTFSDSTIRNAEDRGSEYWIGLTGGVSRDENVAESVAGAAARFVGIIVEVTVTY